MAHVVMTNIMNVVMTNHMRIVDNITIVVFVSAIVVAVARVWQQPAPCIAVIPILIWVLCCASCMQEASTCRKQNKARK